MLTIVANDFHIPFQDKTLVKKWLSFINQVKPDKVILAGDVIDAWELSHFDKAPKSSESFQEEIDLGRRFLEDLREVHSGEIVYIEGNHSFRLKSYLMSIAPELYGIKSLTLDVMMGMEDLNIEFIGIKEGSSKFTDNYIDEQGFYVGHFNLVRGASGATAKALVDKYGVNILQAHVHRGGTYYKTLLSGKTLIGSENFCMCDLKPNYIRNPNWLQGFSIIDDHKLISIPYINNDFSFLGIKSVP